MTLDDVLQDIILHLDSKGNGTIAWEQVREWPERAVQIFQDAGWIKPTAPAKTVVCPGCEESCFMPVHVSPAMQGQPVRAYVACDRRDDMGRIPIPSEIFQQWQVTENQVAQWLVHQLGLRGKPKKDKTAQTMQIGDVQGKKQSGKVELVNTGSVSLRASGHFLPLIEAVYFQGNKLQVDKKALIKIVDRPPSSETKERYQPSKTKSEARKLVTLEMYKNWKKAYRELKRSRRNMSDTWYSQQIEKMEIAQGRSSETIRKNMKK
jgi:hypothetical protein